MKRAIELFPYRRIFPADKRLHLVELHKASGIAYEDMLFFDDERRNRNVESLGVVMRLVEDGVTFEEVDAGVRDWRKRHGIESLTEKGRYQVSEERWKNPEMICMKHLSAVDRCVCLIEGF